MALPSAVKRQVEQAHKLAAEAKVSPPPVEPATRPDARTDQPAPQKAPEPIPEASAELQEAISERNQPDPSPIKQPLAEPPRDDGFIDPSDYEGRYKQLRASRDERRLTLEQELGELRERNRQLETQVQQQHSASESQVKRFEIDEESRQYLGDTEAKLFDQLSSSTQEQIDALRAENDKSRKAQEAQAQRLRQRFFEDLGSMVPNWQALNADQRFLNWLAATDPDTGLQRQSILDGHVDDHDAAGAATLFRRFSQQGNEQASQPSGPGTSPEPVSSRAPSGNGAEEQLVEVYSPDEVTEFYNRKSALYRKGRLVGQTLADIQAEEANIRSAISEGRVY